MYLCYLSCPPHIVSRWFHACVINPCVSHTSFQRICSVLDCAYRGVLVSIVKMWKPKATTLVLQAPCSNKLTSTFSAYCKNMSLFISIIILLNSTNNKNRTLLVVLVLLQYLCYYSRLVVLLQWEKLKRKVNFLKNIIKGKYTEN